VIHVEHADMRRVVRAVGEAGVDDVELLLVGRETMPVRLYEVVDDDFNVAGLRIDPVDVVLFLLLRRLDALAGAPSRLGTGRLGQRLVGCDDVIALILPSQASMRASAARITSTGESCPAR
jgi:hypothetical protein